MTMEREQATDTAGGAGDDVEMLIPFDPRPEDPDDSLGLRKEVRRAPQRPQMRQGVDDAAPAIKRSDRCDRRFAVIRAVQHCGTGFPSDVGIAPLSRHRPEVREEQSNSWEAIVEIDAERGNRPAPVRLEHQSDPGGSPVPADRQRFEPVTDSSGGSY